MSRQEEIKTAFFMLVDQHMDDLLHGRCGRRYSASDFARLLFIHPRHLTDTIKLTTGKSPCDVMEERFMAEAHRMLSETTLSIADIGGKLGWNDPSNFTKFFRHMSGITPMQFRKNIAAVRV
ncbi:AraC family transcriptional regulator [Flavitalea sp. BT771]|uniref:helix-turn-helix domain-containing protein n=1 Tax=Flavitalea sp. BT771 TaxID=3063329 RepID=UPI0026E40419|nr:AraC family transcriptional regulator [Flavitalea sp. BT771]MDO6429126.1 AraC family transcriptional regulator [Flavitalea sp. BT771]MDV6218746.1 AraC family transcriptional regulator [Flavitalea sp. BT771]